MKWPTLVTATVLAMGLSGCGFFGGDEEETPPSAGEATAAETATDTAAALAEAPALEQEPSATSALETAARRAPTAVDRPWNPTHTGTVAPGMTRDQVIAVWGEPFVERSSDNWLYMFFRNGCEISCGTADVVFLQDGQVVDAIVRGRGHDYSGVSSSPPGRTAEPTLPS